MGWLGNQFARPLQLEGRVRADFISVSLPSGSVTGEIETKPGGTRIKLWAREGLLDRYPAIFFSGAVVVIAAVLIAVDVSRGLSVPSGVLALAVVALVLRWYYESRRRWPEYPQNTEDLAQMLAGHIDGTVTTTDGFTPSRPDSSGELVIE